MSRLTPLILVAMLLAACPVSAPVTERVVPVSFEADPEIVGSADTLVIWVKREAEGARQTLPAPISIELGAWDPAAGPFIVDVVPGDVMFGDLILYATLTDSQERSDERAWRFGKPLALATLLFDTETEDPIEVTMTAFEASCDLDGDYFQGCHHSGCCPQFAADTRFIDCRDQISDEDGPEDIHPFQDSEEDSRAGRCSDGIDQDCFGGDSLCDDADADGTPATEDCDDNDPARYPGARELCGDGVDQDCDGLTDDEDQDCLRGQDNDGDGFCPHGPDLNGDGDCFDEGERDEARQDCNDGNPAVNPDVANELACDGQDEDCDGLVDEGLNCEDLDGDGVKDADDCVETEVEGELPGSYDAGRNPQLAEICGDGIDQDCDGQDLPCDPNDRDGDGFVDALLGGGDCKDDDPFTHPDAAERCGDGVDNDCRGGDVACDNDGDNDGFNADVDCDDSNPLIHPDRPGARVEEICDLKDNNCNGIVDEGNPLLLARDGLAVMPRCGFNDTGICQLGWSVCTRQGGQAGIVCADVVNPIEEICDDIDQDCDGNNRNGVANTCGGCANLDPPVGADCGPCGLDSVVCDGENSTRCGGNTFANVCNGCQRSNLREGDSCGDCGRVACDDDRRLPVCNGDHPRNACDGCSTLPNERGASCGTCGLNEYVCRRRNDTVCDGDDRANDCGGCQPSDLDQGDDCGECGTVVCQGDNPVCDDRPENACNGCNALPNEPMTPCGPCNMDRFRCNGENSVECDGNTVANDCGGCQPSELDEGDDCGECGTVVCQGDNPTCNDHPRNTCNGCGTLSNEPDSACGEGCVYACDGEDQVKCVVQAEPETDCP